MSAKSLRLVGQPQGVSLPEKFVFNRSIGVDVFELLDAEGTKIQVLNMICLGTCFQLAEIVRQGSVVLLQVPTALMP